MTEGFGRRLRRERERRQIALASISAKTKISMSFFEGLERDDVSRWPTGIFRRAFIRAYATGIGLDPDEVMQEFLERFPDPAALLPPPPKETTPFSSSRAGKGALRLTLADAGGRFTRKRVLADMSRRFAAVACDAGAVVAIAAGVFLATGIFWLPLAIAMSAYYWGGIVVLGNTPGVWLSARAASRRPHTPSATISIRRRVTSAADGLILGLNRAASAPEPQATLQSEPRPSGS
jgi:transcriptional regulator with XRE-family HTH domain